MKTAAYWIKTLGLTPHPEGGYYRETYRADRQLPAQALPPDFAGPRAASTAIYFLLEAHDISMLHRLRSDEIWHFYAGDPLSVHALTEGGEASELVLGSDPDCGEVLQAVVKAGCWFGARLTEPHPSAFALVGCTVAPGFDFQDFELARRADLLRLYPQHRHVIESLTRA